MYIDLRDPFTQIILIIIVNVAAIIIVEIAIYRINRSPLHPERRPLRGWKEKLGIETGQDLLTFLVIMGVACSVLVTLMFAGLGYIVPIPY